MQKIIIRLVLFCFYITHILYTPAVSAQVYSAGACAATNVDSCIDDTPCKQVGAAIVCLNGVTPPAGGVNIPVSCWRTQSSYSCNNSTNSTNPSCDVLVSQGCQFLSNQCDATTMLNGVCQNYIGTYQCQTSPQKHIKNKVALLPLFVPREIVGQRQRPLILHLVLLSPAWRLFVRLRYMVPTGGYLRAQQILVAMGILA